MRHRDDFGFQMQPVLERRRQGRREPIVASVDPIHRARRRFVIAGELIHQRDEREFIGIGEKESAKPHRRGPQLFVGLRVVEPGRDRAARHLRRDWRVPSLFCESIQANHRLEPPGEQRPSTSGVTLHDPRPVCAVLTDVGESAA